MKRISHEHQDAHRQTKTKNVCQQLLQFTSIIFFFFWKILILVCSNHDNEKKKALEIALGIFFLLFSARLPFPLLLPIQCLPQLHSVFLSLPPPLFLSLSISPPPPFFCLFLSSLSRTFCPLLSVLSLLFIHTPPFLSFLFLFRNYSAFSNLPAVNSQSFFFSFLTGKVDKLHQSSWTLNTTKPNTLSWQQHNNTLS